MRCGDSHARLGAHSLTSGIQGSFLPPFLSSGPMVVFLGFSMAIGNHSSWVLVLAAFIHSPSHSVLLQGCCKCPHCTHLEATSQLTILPTGRKSAAQAGQTLNQRVSTWATDTVGHMLLYCGHCPVYCRIFHSISHLYLLDASGTPTPVMAIKNVFKNSFDIVKVPQGAK